MANGLILNVDTTKSEFQNPMVELRQGDGNYQSLHVTVTNNGDPVDLTGWTITFMGTTAGAHKIVDANAVVDNAVQGTFNYTPNKAWGQDIGEFNKAYFKLVKSDETASGANFRINVLEAVDLTDEEAGNYISVVDVMIDKIKTDMDAKLADTQTTLTNTQNQANTVQTNVDDLNTNVNQLKSKNNNLLTSNNTWSGNNIFTQPINGALNTRQATFTDFADVAKHMDQYIGNWIVSNKIILNGPTSELYFMVYVVKGSYFNDNGYIIVTPFGKIAKQYITIINGGSISGWQLIANDNDVLHKTGNETIAGNKTFTGANTFSGINDFNAAQNFNGGLIGRGNSYLLKTGNGLRVIDSGAQQTTDAGHSWHKIANDDSVVHLSGTETISGNKKFTGANTFTGSNSFNGIPVLAQSATVEFRMWFKSNMKATRFGNLVTLNYSVAPSIYIAHNTTSSETIPSGFRPSFGVYMANGAGSGGAVKVNTDGTISSDGEIPIRLLKAYTATYFTDDAFPTS